MRVVGQECVEDLVGCNGCRQRDSAAGEGFSKANDVGRHAGLLTGEHRAGPCESCEYFIENQQYIVLFGEFLQFCENTCVVEFHSAGALYERFDDDRGDLLGFVV